MYIKFKVDYVQYMYYILDRGPDREIDENKQGSREKHNMNSALRMD